MTATAFLFVGNPEMEFFGKEMSGELTVRFDAA